MEALIVAGGEGRRMGLGFNKVFAKILGREILSHTINAFEQNTNISSIIIAVGESDIDRCTKMCEDYCFKKVRAIIAGGKTRQQSVYFGLRKIKDEYVLIHDGARALITQEEINIICDSVKKFENAALGVKCKDTLKATDSEGNIINTIPRQNTYCVYTPQGFKTRTIKQLHERAINDNLSVTDDCALLEYYDVNVKMIDGKYSNIKITAPEDLNIAESILKNCNR